MSRAYAWYLKTLLLAMLLPVPVVVHGTEVDDRLKEAGALALEGNFAPAWCIWRQLADAGNTEARYNLGWLYHNGQGVAVDDRQAGQLWEKAARAGHGEAQMALAMLYTLGGSIERDRQQAVRWYLAAARQDFEDARLILLDYAQDGDRSATDAIAELVDGRYAGVPAWITGKGNVREEPSIQGKILITLAEDSEVTRFDSSGKWWRVWVPEIGGLGWMHQSLFD